jgi:hypothetical protein
MNSPSNTPTSPRSIEHGVNDLLINAKHGIASRYQKCENQIRRSPVTSVLGAVTAGYFLHRMPVRAILVTQVRVLTALIPPALLLFGAAKVYEFLQTQDRSKMK